MVTQADTTASDALAAKPLLPAIFTP